MNVKSLAARAENSPPSRHAAGSKPGGGASSAGLFVSLAACLGALALAACQSAPAPEGGREPVKAGGWTVETKAAVRVETGVVR